MLVRCAFLQYAAESELEIKTGGGEDGAGGCLLSGGEESPENTVASSRRQSHGSQVGCKYYNSCLAEQREGGPCLLSQWFR